MSSVQAVKAQLVSILTTALPSTQVIYGPSSAITIATSRILTVGRVFGTRDFNSLSTAMTEERYTVDLTCSVDLPETDQTDATSVALADYTAAELAIREYVGGPPLGLEAQGVLSVFPTGEFELNELADSKGRHAVVRWSVSVIAENT
jgi:hypothetical protein